MVNRQAPGLDRVFGALADPTRRAIIARLDAAEALTVSEIAAPLPISLPAVMKHLDVLEQAGLVTRRKAGRTVTCRLDGTGIRHAMGWLSHYQRFWGESLDRLAAMLEDRQ
jgi:DNA-binding transcriptional ArsR family regulator